MSLVRFSRNYPSVLDRFFDNDLFDWSHRNFSNTNTTLPSVNIKESNMEFMVEVAAPGLEKGDFKIELNRDVLTVSSEKKVENDTKEGQQFTCREFSYQSFSRSFTLPNIADGDKIAARYENGILSITIPKKEEIISKMNRQIEIQ
jgi:HSP20 family protein